MNKEKSISIKIIYSFCFLALMIILGSAFFYYTAHHFLIETRANKNGIKKEAITVSFAEQYPFEESKEETTPNDKINLGFASRYANFISYIANTTEIYSSTREPFSSELKNIQYLFSKFTFNDIFIYCNNAFVKLSNGYIVELFPYSPSTKARENILSFSSWLKDKNIKSLTLINADKSDDSISKFPKGVEHGYSRMVEEYKTFLDKNDLQYIEAKKNLIEKNDDFYSWFYKTDPHWNAHAGLVVAQETARVLNDEFSIPTDTSTLDESTFKLVVYPNSFFGTYGYEVGKINREDMDVLYPKSKTDFHIEIPSLGIDKTDSFENTLINQNKLSSDASFYGAFLYGELPLIKIENNNCKNGTRVLVIKLSFADVVCPYLANAVQYLDVIDPRVFDGSIRSYIEQTKPDCVILCTGVPTGYDEEFLHLK